MVLNLASLADANILFDEGAQCSFMFSKLSQKLRISPQDSENINISAFEGEPPSLKQLGVTTFNIETLEGEQISLSVLLVPMIAAPLQNTNYNHLLIMKQLEWSPISKPSDKRQEV